MAHSALVGGSSADRFIHCIGSDKLIATLPTTAETSVFALEGTLLHNAMEDIIANDLSVEDTIGKAYDVGVDDKGDIISMEIDDEHITEKIYPAFAWFNEYCPLDAEIWLEHRVEFSGALKGAYGTADVLWFSTEEKRAGLIDWKFGSQPVYAEDNAQLKFYLAAAVQQGTLPKRKKYEAAICQPLGDDPPASLANFDIHALTAFIDDLTAAKKAKDQGIDTLTAGDWCKWCGAQPVCPAWINRGKQALESLPLSNLKDVAKKPAPGVLADAYTLAVQVGKWSDAVKEAANTAIDQGHQLPGYKRVVHLYVREWTNSHFVSSWLRREGLKAQDMFEPKQILSVAKIERKIGKSRMREDIIRRVPGGFSIVPEDDPRPEYGTGSDPDSPSQKLAASAKSKSNEETER
jgi:hypothetical protein